MYYFYCYILFHLFLYVYYSIFIPFLVFPPSDTDKLLLFLQLYHLGKDYPAGSDYFHQRLHQAFMKNKDVTDPEKIKELIERGNYVVKELEAMYMLKKYRALKSRYYSN